MIIKKTVSRVHNDFSGHNYGHIYHLQVKVKIAMSFPFFSSGWIRKASADLHNASRGQQEWFLDSYAFISYIRRLAATAWHQSSYFKTFMAPRNRFRGFRQAVNRCLRSPGWESIPGLLKRFKNTGSDKPAFQSCSLSFLMVKKRNDWKTR